MAVEKFKTKKALITQDFGLYGMERAMGIEPTLLAWKAETKPSAN